MSTVYIETSIVSYLRQKPSTQIVTAALPNAPEIPQIADEIMSLGVLPPKAQVDALHIASVARHRIQYLLTWNCKHIANAKVLPRIHNVLTMENHPSPPGGRRRSPSLRSGE